jgi:Ca2+-binding EF-hand superfamily protein
MTYHEFHELMMPSVSQRYTHELDGIVSAFRNNNNHNNPFNKLARRIVAENAPPTKDIEKIKNAFFAMDVDQSGTLTMEELTKGVRDAGYVVSDSDLTRLFHELDTDGTGLVRYHEFVAGAIDSNILLGDNLLRWVFDFMDDDDSNTITTANLKVSVLPFSCCSLHHACTRVCTPLHVRMLLMHVFTFACKCHDVA